MPFRPASLLLAVCIGLLAAWGMARLQLPPLARLMASHSLLSRHLGHGLLAAALGLAWFHHEAEAGLRWLAGRVARWASMLAMAGLLLVDAAMHWLAIPHVEGWWLPLLGGGALAGGLRLWRGKSGT